MKLRSFTPILLSLFLLTACRNEENRDEIQESTESTREYEETSTEEQKSSPAQSTGSTQSSSDERQPGSGSIDTEGTGSDSQASALSEGNYIKDGETDSNCACYCINLSFSGTTELCLREETMFITTRMSRGNGNVVNIYLVEPANRSTEGEDIPWNDFDKNTPIATITPAANGQMELDWLGFTINGDLAMDYAIYGKKTLEGTYKKK